jgi:hypothetical protein
MNSLIKRLKTESGIDDNPDQEGLDVFARLIVEECAELFPMQFTDEQYQRRIDKTIKKHFGVIQ